MYHVTEYQPAVNFGPAPTFATKAAALAYARSERNDFIKYNGRGCRKERVTHLDGSEQFLAVHPFYGVQYAATVRAQRED